MKPLKFLLALLLSTGLTGAVCAQDIETHDISGTWYGVFSNYLGEKQRLLIVLEKQRHGYRGQLKSPDKTDVPLAMDSVDYSAGTLLFRINEIGVVYKGGWDAANHRFNGYLTQSGDRFPLNISKDEVKREDLYRRPQDPHPPYPYRQEEVVLTGGDEHIALAGVFTRPADSARRYPVVIALSGSGPQNRNGEVIGHKPLAVIADHLSRSGIAVLRLDDRGVGGSSGSYDAATLEDQAADVRAAIAYLRRRRDIDTAHIGLLGHSEGAAVAQIVAAGNNGVDFVVSMAGPGISGRQALDLQMQQVARATRQPDSVVRKAARYYQPFFDLLVTEKDTNTIRAKGREYLTAIYRQFNDLSMPVSEKSFVEGSLAAQTTPHALSVYRHNPAAWLEKVKCPVLAINGDKDLQTDAALNLGAIEEALRKGGNQLVTVRKFEGLNHLFQRCNTCQVAEYGALDETISPTVLEFITKWTTTVVGL